MRRFALLLVLIALAGEVAGHSPGAATTRAAEAVVLVTLDGARVEEIFGGLDADVFRSTLAAGQTLEGQDVYRRYWAETPEARREKLLPFFWRKLVTEYGSIAGNPRLDSHVRVTNRHRFSYPGYAELLLGEAHDAVIASNDPIRNPYVTVLETLRDRLGLPREGVAAFASWNVFDAIVSHDAGAITANAGPTPYERADPLVRQLSALQTETPTPWDGVRYDAYTFRLGMAHLAAARPRVLYLAFDETDDWAHDGRYDRLLDAYARTDRYLGELWTWLQSQDGYRGRTHLIVTTDHGRGRTTTDWREHGAEIEGAQDVWIALVSPRLDRRGEWRAHAPLGSNQVAATLASWAGVDWVALHPAAGTPIP